MPAMKSSKRVLAGLERNLQSLAREIGRPYPALYLLTAAQEILRVAAALSLHTISRAGAVHSASIPSTPANSNTPVTPATLAGAPAVSSLEPPGPTSAASPASSCCTWHAAAFCSSILGLSSTDACTQALPSLLQHSSSHAPAHLLLQHQQQAAAHSTAVTHHRQHYQHSVHDALRCLLYGRSMFALYAVEPSQDTWLSLAAALSAHEELQAERPHALLCHRRAGGPRMQPHWVARRVSITQQAPAASYRPAAASGR